VSAAIVDDRNPQIVVPYCLTYPGIWVDLPDRDVAHDISSLLHLIESTLTEAAISLGAYIASRNIPRRSMRSAEACQQNVNASRLYEQRVRAEWGVSEFDFARYDEIRAEADRRHLKDAFAANVVPEGYISQMPFVHAKGFLTAAHTIRQALIQCAKINAIQTQADVARVAIDAALPKLKGVRDSTAHVDERVQGMTRGREIQLQPVQNRMVRAPGGCVLIIGSLNGDNFGNTMDDGNYGEVPVTIDTFNLFARVFQEFLDKLPWRGGPRVVPRL
jgi:hypothetical protein